MFLIKCTIIILLLKYIYSMHVLTEVKTNPLTPSRIVTVEKNETSFIVRVEAENDKYNGSVLVNVNDNHQIHHHVQHYNLHEFNDTDGVREMDMKKATIPGNSKLANRTNYVSQVNQQRKSSSNGTGIHQFQINNYQTARVINNTYVCNASIRKVRDVNLADTVEQQPILAVNDKRDEVDYKENANDTIDNIRRLIINLIIGNNRSRDQDDLTDKAGDDNSDRSTMEKTGIISGDVNDKAIIVKNIVSLVEVIRNYVQRGNFNRNDNSTSNQMVVVCNDGKCNESKVILETLSNVIDAAFWLEMKQSKHPADKKGTDTVVSGSNDGATLNGGYSSSSKIRKLLKDVLKRIVYDGSAMLSFNETRQPQKRLTEYVIRLEKLNAESKDEGNLNVNNKSSIAM